MSSLSHTSYGQRHSVSSRASSPSLSDDEDAIMPAGEVCPIAPATPSPETTTVTQESRRGSVGSVETCSMANHHLDLSSWDDLDTTHLWRRMLLLQKKFHCYNSARMTAALEDEHVQAVVPSRACLELLNEGLGKLPEEARKQASHFLHGGRKAIKGGL